MCAQLPTTMLSGLPLHSHGSYVSGRAGCGCRVGYLAWVPGGIPGCGCRAGYLAEAAHVPRTTAKVEAVTRPRSRGRGPEKPREKHWERGHLRVGPFKDT